MGNVTNSVSNHEETIPESDFVNSEAFKDYEEFRVLSHQIEAKHI